MNKCVIVGNLTRDPELSQTPSGISVCRFALAVNRPYANANGEREVDYINVVAWRALAENCGKYCVKGMKVAVSGSLQSSNYEDRNGEKRYRTDLVADEVEYYSKPKEDAAEPKQTAQTAKKKTVKDLKSMDDNNGLPF